MDLILIVGGLVLILAGANYLTDGAAAAAKRFNVSEFVIGMTIVALGTSAPELVVSTFSAFKGSGAMAIGNVVGSNAFNTYVVLGMCALFAPIVLTPSNIKRDIPMGILASVILLLVCMGGTIERLFGAVMLLIYIALIIYSIRTTPANLQAQSDEIKPMPLWLTAVMVVGGLTALIVGGHIFLMGAVNVAIKFGVPDSVIAITLLAGGTSLPEFAAAVVSLVKGKTDIALGNVIGSNIANILLVLGVTSSITPLAMGSITLFDILVVLLGSFIIYLSGVIGKRQIGRVEGGVMVCVYVGYIWWIVTGGAAF